jgi:hypothetical protein
MKINKNQAWLNDLIKINELFFFRRRFRVCLRVISHVMLPISRSRLKKKIYRQVSTIVITWARTLYLHPNKTYIMSHSNNYDRQHNYYWFKISCRKQETAYVGNSALPHIPVSMNIYAGKHSRYLHIFYAYSIRYVKKSQTSLTCIITRINIVFTITSHQKKKKKMQQKKRSFTTGEKKSFYIHLALTECRLLWQTSNYVGWGERYVFLST